MAFNIAKATIDLKVNNAGLNNALNKTETMMRNFAGSVSKWGSIAGAALGGIGLGEALKLSANMQQTQIAMGVMLQNMTKGKQMVQSIFQYSAKTPFQFTGLTESTRMLLTFGASGDQALAMMKRLSNVAAGNQQRLMELSQAYGEVVSTGHLMGQQLLMFERDGFNPLQVMVSKTGKSMMELRQEMAKGQISVQQVTQAIVEATSAGGLFYHMNEKEAKTLKGVFSTLKDNVQITLIKIGNAITKNLNLKQHIADFTKDLQRITPAIVRITSTVTSVMGELADGVGAALGDIYKFVAGHLAQIKQTVGDAFNYIGPILLEGFAVWKAEVVAVGQVFGDTFKFIGSLFAPLGNLIGGFGHAMGAARDWVMAGLFTLEFGFKHWKDVVALALLKVGAATVDFKDRAVWVFTEVIPQTLEWMGENWKSILTDLGDLTATVFKNLASNIWKVFKNLPGLIRGSVDFSSLWTPITSGFKSTLKSLPKIAAMHQSDLSKTLQATANFLSKDLTESLRQHVQKRMADIDKTMAKFKADFTSKAIGKSPDNALDSGGFGKWKTSGGTGGAIGHLQKTQMFAVDQLFSKLQQSASGVDPAKQTALNTKKVADEASKQVRQQNEMTQVLKQGFDELKSTFQGIPIIGP